MSGRWAHGVIVGSLQPLVDALTEEVGVELLRVAPEEVERPLKGVEWSDGGSLVWIHLVPARPGDAGRGSSEAALLIRSAKAALRAAAGAGRAVTFLALLPSRGLLTGSAGLESELARGTFEALMRAGISSWSSAGHRILGIVYAGIEKYPVHGQRPEGEVRSRTPIDALASVGQLAAVVRFLGSARAAYVTGTLLHVDGGWNAYSWIYPARTI